MGTSIAGGMVRGALVAAALAATGCGSTGLKYRVPANPLPAIAREAAEDYRVTWVDERTLQLRKWWPIQSVLTIGYECFCADLHYESGEFSAEFYTWNSSLLKPVWGHGSVFPLWIPFFPVTDSMFGFPEGPLQSMAWSNVDQILDWAGVPKAGRYE